MRAVPSVLLLVLLLPLLACEESQGGLHVEVNGPLSAGVDFDRLSVVVSLPDGTALAAAVVEEVSPLPATFNFESGPSTPAGTQLFVRATAERAGIVQSAASGEATLAPGTGARLVLTLPPVREPPDAGPPVEACDNGVDDDGDDLPDCADPECDRASCQPAALGLTCSGGICGCASGPTGTVVARPGFTPRTDPVVLFPTAGPYAGALVVAGGRDGTGRPVATVEAYFASEDRFTRGALAVARAEAVGLELADGGVLVLGGVREDGQPESSAEWLRAEASTTRIPFLPALSAQSVLAGQLGPDVVLAGGQLSQGTGAPARDAVVRVEVGSSGSALTTPLGQLAVPCPAGGAPVGDVFVLVGACAGQGPTASTVEVHPSGFLRTGPGMPVALESPAVVGLGGGRALVLGGREALPDGGTAPTARAFLLTQVESSVRVSELLPMDRPRAAPRAVRAGNGWVYVEDGAGAPPAWFDPAAGRFTEARPLLPPRTGHALAGGAEGRVYAVGGRGPDGGLAETALQADLRCQ